MAKFHVKANGDMGKCTAQEGGCPFSSEGAEHFDNFQNAAIYAEAVIARSEGGSFSNTSFTRYPTPEEEFPPTVDDYSEHWDIHEHLGQRIDRGDTFAYNDRIYRADDWEWNRATLVTYIEATDVETGEKETIDIHQGSEERVSFLDKNAVVLPEGNRVRVKDLDEAAADDSNVASELAEAFHRGFAEDDVQATTGSGREFFGEVREVEYRGKTFYAVYGNDIPSEDEDDSIHLGRSLSFYDGRYEAIDALDRRRDALQWL